MTPQSSFAVVATIEPGREGDLRTMLASMNLRPGVVDPENGLVPFGRFERLHFARFVVLEDRTGEDIAAHGVVLGATRWPWPSWEIATGRGTSASPTSSSAPGRDSAAFSLTAGDSRRAATWSHG